MNQDFQFCSAKLLIALKFKICNLSSIAVLLPIQCINFGLSLVKDVLSTLELKWIVIPCCTFSSIVQCLHCTLCTVFFWTFTRTYSWTCTRTNSWTWTNYWINNYISLLHLLNSGYSKGFRHLLLHNWAVSPVATSKSDAATALGPWKLHIWEIPNPNQETSQGTQIGFYITFESSFSNQEFIQSE